MKCTNCGFENEDNTTTCIVCGFSLIKERKKNINDNIQQKISNKDIYEDTSNINQQTYKNKNQINPIDNQENNQNSNVNEFSESENNLMNSNDNYFDEFNEINDNQFKNDKKNTFSSNKENTFPSDKNDFFSTRNVVIICLLIILLTFVGCVYAIIMSV